MDTRHLVDPTLLPGLDMFPPMTLSGGGLGVIRQASMEVFSSMPVPPHEDVEIREVFVPGPVGASEVRVLVYLPRRASGRVPVVLNVHGGGYVMGAPEMMKAAHIGLVWSVGCAVVSVDYRLAPEHPAPAGVEDCYAALRWIFAQADALGFDTARVALNGQSAGGGMSAALALLARDRGEFPIVFQQLNAPMLDDRTCVRSDPHPCTGEFVWTAEQNLFGWSSLLGHAPGLPGVSPYASPARAEDLSGLPATYISVGALDLFLEENLEYARRLTRAGVSVELHVIPGAYHGAEIIRDAAPNRAQAALGEAALKRAFGLPA